MQCAQLLGLRFGVNTSTFDGDPVEHWNQRARIWARQTWIGGPALLRCAVPEVLLDPVEVVRPVGRLCQLVQQCLASAAVAFTERVCGVVQRVVRRSEAYELCTVQLCRRVLRDDVAGGVEPSFDLLERDEGLPFLADVHRAELTRPGVHVLEEMAMYRAYVSEVELTGDRNGAGTDLVVALRGSRVLEVLQRPRIGEASEIT